ncbi:NAD(P)(+) transhydrogenase (AB-specific) [Methylocella silvestris BL2]|uniref:NAD(P) transhydrogenase subunit alpha n=1 Tax=Methylocella silvestris (strain DSM 15510 / CIP 108128 / LMG 27833 / NCIMB 13906 / BL2) TaxID=395965 RepID=B8EQE9_METSB|nr:Re/Si-specific NAD(P)(+) transhydrogenase subunit alpha [Methylocella silvestris]ACK52162.1 NAD(P)(+) transhydrogenase (AB-specific) [Methylocella silvestris BL2]
MRIAVQAETDPHESRVAATPETVKTFIGLGAEVAVETGAGRKSAIADDAYAAAGATIAPTAAAAAAGADVVLRVRRPAAAELAGVKPGAVVLAILDPYENLAALQSLAGAGVSAFAMELIPRITRAQSMDVLSSQANLAGYRAVIDAAASYDRAIPMMTTAAGSIQPARIFIMGVGVAGLQAIATARRIGGLVTATDVRPATKEQVLSLGAKFIAVEDEEFAAAETAAGYAKPMSPEYQAKQAELTASHIAKQDIVITTALIPGRKAPVLITAEMVASMQRGSIIIDLAVERGGNCELSRPGETVISDNGVKITGNLNVPGRVPASASALYARNLVNFLKPLIDKETHELAIDWDDEIIKATALTRDGALPHPNFQAPAPEPQTEAPAESRPVAEAQPPASENAAEPAAETPALVDDEPPQPGAEGPEPAAKPRQRSKSGRGSGQGKA